MIRIDADTHVDETEDTWEHIDEADRRFKPITIAPTTGPVGFSAAARRLNSKDQAWSIDGKEYRRPVRDYQKTGVTAAQGQLLDVPARLAHMDELRIDIQVIYPTLFIATQFAHQEELELTLCRSYNRWLADRTEQSNGRLRWVAVLPLESMEEAIKELQWAKDRGACGVFKRGLECGYRADNPYFFPLYEAAAHFDIPICIHTGQDHRALDIYPQSMGAVQAFYPLVVSGIPEKFPTLRLGFIEAGASWVPYLLSILASEGRSEHLQAVELEHKVEVDRELFRRSRIYVASQSQDDLAYILKFGLEDNLIVGTDYMHQDQSAELMALDNIEQRGAKGEFSAEVARKILEENPRRFYGL